MNYIEEVKRELDKEMGMDGTYKHLLDVYVLLVFIKGNRCTNKDVHDAWSIWQNNINNNHPSLISFNKLTETVQELDTEYRNAIIKVSNYFKE